MSDDSVNQPTSGTEAEKVRPPKPRIRFIHILPVVILLGVSGVFFVRLFGEDPSRVPSVMLNRPAPEFTLAPLENLRRAGEPVPGFLPRGSTPARRWRGEGEHRQCLGFLVRALPRRASRADGSGR